MACDPPFDWSAVAGPEGLDPFLDREKNIAAVIEAEVLEKGRKALMLFGVHHLMRGMGSAVDAYERHGFANLTYVIADHRGFGNHTALNSDNDELESRLLSWNPALNPDVQGTWLATLDSAYVGEEPGRAGYPGVDAHLYVGRRDLLLREPRSAQAVLDTDYLAELERRATAIEAPADSRMHPDVAFQLELRKPHELRFREVPRRVWSLEIVKHEDERPVISGEAPSAETARLFRLASQSSG